MYILTIKGHEQEGAYAVADDDGERSLYLFEEKDDAERYGGCLLYTSDAADEVAGLVGWGGGGG